MARSYSSIQTANSRSDERSCRTRTPEENLVTDGSFSIRTATHKWRANLPPTDLHVFDSRKRQDFFLRNIADKTSLRSSFINWVIIEKGGPLRSSTQITLKCDNVYTICDNFSPDTNENLMSIDDDDQQSVLLWMIFLLIVWSVYVWFVFGLCSTGFLLIVILIEIICPFSNFFISDLRHGHLLTKRHDSLNIWYLSDFSLMFCNW